MIGLGEFGRIGVVANPCAGAGPETLRDVLDRLFDHLRGGEVVLNEETFEAATAAACRLPCTKTHGPAGDARRLTEALLAAGVDTVIGVGGDGTLGDVASALVGQGSAVRLLGVGVGSSNVGPLVACTAAGLDRALGSAWVDVGVHALDVRVDDEPVGIAFHDATPANTHFGTRNGRRLDLDSAAALRGEDRPAEPRSVCLATTWVAKNGEKLLSGDAVAGGQIVASPLNDVEECRGRAVSGFLCWGPYVGCRGIVAVASAVVIRTRLSREDLLAAEPLRLFHIGLAPEDRVDVGGLPQGATIVVDGTPRAAAGSDRIVSFRVMESAVRALRVARSGAQGREAECSTEGF